MRPYLAVIADSFRAALASRILWVAMLAIWLLLAALAPIGYREDFTTTFRGRDFYNGTQMKAMLARGLVDPDEAETAVGRLAAAMPEDLRRQLRRVGEGDEVRIRLSRLADALNDRLDDESTWYDAEAWKSTVRLRELRELEEADDLSESLTRRRTRLRIEAALPGVFESRAARSIVLTYLGFDFPANFQIDKLQFVNLINQWVVPAIINWLLGFLLVFLGILVTAHIVPDMLQPGSLHLLLSKPVSRTLLFLSKFLGGCTFVFLCVVQLIVGLYLVAGFRLDVWNVRMLWCIPVSVFLFAVFYSVSAVAGLRWRSPILAIGVTCIFGLTCFVIGFVGGLFDGFVTRPAAIQHVAMAGDVMVGATRGGGLVRWNADGHRWDEIVESDAMSFDRILPPVTLDASRVVTSRVRGGRVNPFGSGASDLLVISEASGWESEPSLRLPTATSRLYAVGDESLMALNASGLALTDSASVLEAAGEERPEEEEEESPQDKAGWLSKLTQMMGGATTGFRPILPSRVSLAQPRGLAVDGDGDGLVLVSRGRLTRLQRPSESSEGDTVWEVTAQRQLEGEPSRQVVIAASDQVAVVARQEEPIEFFDPLTLQGIATLELDPSLVPVAAQSLGDGERFALVTSDGRCRIMSAKQGAASWGKALPIREVETVRYLPEDDSLAVVHHVDRVDFVNAESLAAVDSIRPSLSRWRMVDHYAVTPLRTLTPQTGELGETIAAMVSGKSAVTIREGSGESELVRYHVTRPVLSCAGFIVFMLTVGCVYFARRDF